MWTSKLQSSQKNFQNNYLLFLFAKHLECDKLWVQSNKSLARKFMDSICIWKLVLLFFYIFKLKSYLKNSSMIFANKQLQVETYVFKMIG